MQRPGLSLKDRVRRGVRDRGGADARLGALAAPPAHKATRANDFNGLSALLCDYLRLRKRELHFA